MKLGKRIPVEPLDEERLTNIERRLVVAVSAARPAAPSRRPLALVTAMLAAAVVVLLGWTLRRSPVPATPTTVAVVEPAPAQHVSVTTDAEKTNRPSSRLARWPSSSMIS